MDANLQEDRVEEQSPAALKHVAGSIRFDWIMIVLSGWLLAGVYIDGWAHNHFNIIDTFFTPWHAVLYSGFLSIAIFLVVTLALNTRRGYFWWSAVPPGYGFSLIGMLVFGIGGISDFFWHTLFGFDVELATLLSPTHLMLAAGGVLIVSGPLRAAWLRSESATPTRWFSQLPLVISLTFVLGALAFMTSFAHPFVSLPATSRYKLSSNYFNSIYLNDLIETWGVLGILLQTGLLIGTMLLIMRRQRAPLGTFTVMFSISLSTASVLLGNYFLIPVAVLGGLAADVFYKLFRPSVERAAALRLFVFVVPVCLFALYFLDLRLFKTMWWPLTIWSGSIVMAGIVGLLLSYLFVPPLKNGAKPAPSFLTSFQLTRRRMLVGLVGLGLAAGGMVVAGGLVLRRSRASDTGKPPLTGGPIYFYATGSQAILNVPALLRQASSGAVNSVAWSPNGQWIASANDDGTVQIWPATIKAGAGGEGAALYTYRKHIKAVTGLAWSPDGHYIASASEDGTVQVWNVTTGNIHLSYEGHTGRVLALAWSPDDGQIASAGEDKTVQIWNASTGAHISTYRGHSEAVITVAWSPDSKRIVSASVKGSARVWNVASAVLISAFLIDDGSGNTASVVWSPDGKYVASAKSNLSVWDASTGVLLYVYIDESFDIISVAWAPDGKRFITGLANGSVYIWASFLSQKNSGLPSFREGNVKLGGNALLSGGGGDSSSAAFLLLCNGHTGTVNAVDWSPDSIHAVSAGADGTMQFVDTSVGNTRITYQNRLTSANWSPDGTRIASIIGMAAVEIWDVASATAIVTYEKHPSSSTITSLAWSPDGRKMISAGDDGTVLIWDTHIGATLLFPAKQASSMVEVTWLLDGKRVAMIDGQGRMQVWDAATGRILMHSQRQKIEVITAAWSPDKRRIGVVDKNGQALVWDAVSGSVLLPPLLYLRGVTALAWTPNGKQLASAAGGSVQIWDAATGEVLFSYQGDQSTIYDLTWATDGKRLAFTSVQGVQVWNVTRGTLLLTYRGLAGNPQSIYTVSWSSDGKSIASTTDDGSVLVWLASPA